MFDIFICYWYDRWCSLGLIFQLIPRSLWLLLPYVKILFLMFGRYYFPEWDKKEGLIRTQQNTTIWIYQLATLNCSETAPCVSNTSSEEYTIYYIVPLGDKIKEKTSFLDFVARLKCFCHKICGHSQLIMVKLWVKKLRTCVLKVYIALKLKLHSTLIIMQ